MHEGLKMRIVLIIFLFTLLWGVGFAQDKTLELKSIPIGGLKLAGFSLKSEKDIYIDAEGAGEHKHSHESSSMMSDPAGMFAYAWILNAKKRDVVWQMTIDNTNRLRKTRFNRSFKDEIRLPAGEYELYYNARLPVYGVIDDGFFSLGKLLDKLFKDDEWYKEDQRKWQVTVTGVDEIVDENSVSKYHKAIKEEAVVTLTGLLDSEFRQEGFELKKPGNFEIIALGEAYEGETFDYGWIVDASNSQKIWETLPDKGKHAGGALKNRIWRDKISLKAGNYWVYFVMDDSHAPGAWNANPPFDPDFYGITIRGIAGEFDPESTDQILKQKVQPIIELVQLGDEEFVQEGFKLSSPTQLRIYAIGEGRKGEMFDYGWIIDLNTGEKVWEMNFNRTRNAGGANKNRLIDEIITLSKGSYIVNFVTDGSHSFRRWNSSQPYNPSSWGITIYPADPKFSKENIQKLEEQDLSKGIIAQIIRVRDGRYIQERFTIDRKTSLRIYAIGEGDWDEMYDYGWIEKASTGEKVWEMTYDKTRWAGGARKNRKTDQTISLQADRYILFYSTDDSHSFNDWNDDAPDDPYYYGITLYEVRE